MTTIHVNTDELHRLANSLVKFDQHLEEFRSVINCDGFMALLAEWESGATLPGLGADPAPFGGAGGPPGTGAGI